MFKLIFSSLFIVLFAFTALSAEIGQPASRDTKGIKRPTVRLFQSGSMSVNFCVPDADENLILF